MLTPLFSSEGTNEYTTCEGLLTQSSSTWPESSLFQIAANGVSLNKLVIGKPATAGDASNGFIAPATLAGCLAQAKAKGWSAGAMVWEVSSFAFFNKKSIKLIHYAVPGRRSRMDQDCPLPSLPGIDFHLHSLFLIPSSFAKSDLTASPVRSMFTHPHPHFTFRLRFLRSVHWPRAFSQNPGRSVMSVFSKSTILSSNYIRSHLHLRSFLG